MSYHVDDEVNQAIIKLLDALCMHERNSGRRSTLILIPHEPDQEIIVAQDGKPLPEIMRTAARVDQVYFLAMSDRKNKLMGGK